MVHRRPPRLADSEYIGAVRIFLTMCTLQRTRIFITSATVDNVRAEMLRTGESYGVEIIAYCFMPDHVHALIQGLAEDSNLLKWMKMLRQRSGHCYRTRNRRRLWQEGYVDRFLRDEEATLDVARYVVGNPIRAGLCDDLRRYPYWGSSRYTIEELIGSLA